MTHIIYIVYTFPFNEKPKLLNNLSANTLQLIINQLAGLVIFYILSVSLDKNSFWANQSCACANAGHIQYPVVRYRSDRRQKVAAVSNRNNPFALSQPCINYRVGIFTGLLFAGRMAVSLHRLLHHHFTNRRREADDLLFDSP